MRNTNASARSSADSSVNILVDPDWTKRASSARREEVVDTSRDISDAVVRKARSSMRAGLVWAAEEPGALGAWAVLPPGAEAALPGVLWMDFMGPVVGMELAMAKNSAVRSVMV